MNASGILGNTPAGIRRLWLMGFSGIVTKTITPNPRKGFPPPIIVELPTGGFINAVGLANPGKSAVKHLVKSGRELGIPIVVSIAGRDTVDFIEVAIEAEDAGASGVELNLSCPHTEGYGSELGVDPGKVYEVVKEVASSIRIPVIAKLGVSDRVLVSSGKALEAGAQALAVINTVKVILIDIYTLKPVLSAKYGGMSGPPIHPIAVRVVYDIYREYSPDIIGVGGVINWQTAAELILAGAKGLQVGTGAIINLGIVKEVTEGLKKWLREIGFSNIIEVVGMAHKA